MDRVINNPKPRPFVNWYLFSYFSFWVFCICSCQICIIVIPSPSPNAFLISLNLHNSLALLVPIGFSLCYSSLQGRSAVPGRRASFIKSRWVRMSSAYRSNSSFSFINLSWSNELARNSWSYYTCMAFLQIFITVMPLPLSNALDTSRSINFCFIKMKCCFISRRFNDIYQLIWLLALFGSNRAWTFFLFSLLISSVISIFLIHSLGLNPFSYFFFNPFQTCFNEFSKLASFLSLKFSIYNNGFN